MARVLRPTVQCLDTCLRVCLDPAPTCLPALAGAAPLGLEQGSMPHDDGRGVAREASRRSRGNAETLHPFQRRLSGSPIDPVGTVGPVFLLLRQHTLVHVHDHLVAVARRPWVQIGRQRALPPPGPARRRAVGQRRSPGGLPPPGPPAPPGVSGRPPPPARTAPRRRPRATAGRESPPSRRHRPKSRDAGARAGACRPRPRPPGPPARRSTWAAVAHRAKSSSSDSFTGVATRVSARTFE